jgi:RNA polymerase sigma-70 factor, ECF subfamily
VDELSSLARTAAQGDRAALTELIRATQNDVWRLCAHLVDPAAADDLAQETYLRAVPALPGFRGEAPFRAWLLTIARRVCAAEIKSRQRAREAVTRIAAASDAAAFPDSGLRAELTLLLAGLDPDRRAAFVLTQVLGCSYAETAAMCDCPIGTIRSRVARARADLDAMLTQDSMADYSLGSLHRPDPSALRPPSFGAAYDTAPAAERPAYGSLNATAAIANAVYHATGRRIRSLPITIEQLL